MTIDNGLRERSVDFAQGFVETAPKPARLRAKRSGEVSPKPGGRRRKGGAGNESRSEKRWGWGPTHGSKSEAVLNIVVPVVGQTTVRNRTAPDCRSY